MNSLKDVLDNIWGFVPLKVVAMTIRYGFWDYLSSNAGIRKEQVLDRFGWKERPFDRISDLLVDLELILQENGKMKLTRISQKWLVSSSTCYIGDFIIRADKLSKAYSHMEQLMQQDKPDAGMYESTVNAFGKDNSETRAFANNMDAMTKEFIEGIVSKIDFSRKKNILDVGAGIGTVSCFLSNHYPLARFLVLDLPGVAALSQEYINVNAIHPDKITVVASDWRNIKAYTGNRSFDLIILSQILHEEKMENSKELIKLCSELLAEKGQLAIIGFLDDSGDYSLLSHIFSLNMLFEVGSDNILSNEITKIAEMHNISLESKHYLNEGRMLWLGRKS